MNLAVFDPNAISGHSIRSLIDFRADTTPDNLFLIDPDSRISVTYRDLRSRAQSVAARVAAHGIAPGESVAYALANGIDSALCVLGILYGGYLATAINLVAGNHTISYVLAHSETRLIFVQGQTVSLIEEALAGQPSRPDVVEVTKALFTTADTGAVPQVPTRDWDGLLMYTSGTTGRPKGVVLTQGNLISGGINTALAHQLSAQDCALCVLPLYHINGLCVTIIGPLVSGGRVVIPQRFSVSSFWNILRDNDCTWFSVVPTQISYLLHDIAERGSAKKKFPRLRFGRSASAPLSPDVQQAFEECFGVPIVETMGLTETAAQILSNPLPPGTRKVGSPGVAVGNEVMIANERQNEVPRGQEGEVLVRGPNVMRGYLKDEEATRNALTAEGWLRTGDLGRMDQEGYVYITGRLKEIIIKGGENIAPREVDEALYSHADVIEAAAFACDCERYGQRIEAGVVLKAQAKVSEAELIEICKKKIGAFKAPDRIHFMDELPKGPSGKIQRIKLAELVRRAVSS